MQGALTRTRTTLGSPGLSTILNVVGLIVLLIVLLVAGQKIASRGLAFFVQILAFGVADGAIYALVALGYTMVYGIIELINFAHGDVFTLGAFIGLAVMPVLGLTESKSGGLGMLLPLLGVFVAAMLLCGLINVTIERVAYRPLRNAPRLAPLITAIGMSSILEGAMFMWRGPFNLHFPNLLPNPRLSLGGGAGIGLKDLIVIVAAVVLLVALTLFINGSRLGKAMRATAQDRDAAQLMGIDINLTIATTFFIGAILAGAGGILYGLYFNNVDAFLGFRAGLIAFTAAVFGGIGNIPGAALGGLLIGMLISFNDAYFASQWTEVLVFGILIVVLVFRPTGLLGMRVPEK